jgi:hypothetical protein
MTSATGPYFIRFHEDPIAMLRSALLTSLVVLLIPVGGQAAKVKVWHHHSAGHYEKAKFKDTVVSSEGALRLSRQLKPFAGLDATHVWDVVEDKQGSLYVATGDAGKIYKVSPEGRVSLACRCEDSQVLSLALGADGSVYAGTGPTGQLVRIYPTGRARIIARNLGSYVWSLAIDARGQTIYAGTGPKGRIYQVTPEGKSRVFFKSKQEHVLCLALGTAGRAYAGTDKGGLVYRIDAKGKGFVLYQAAQAEVRSLLVTSKGIYAGTSSPTRKHGGGRSGILAGGGSLGSAPRITATSLSSNNTGKKTKVEKAKPAAFIPSSSASSESSKGSSSSALPPPGSGENSLYHIRADGTVREIFREKAMLLSLLRQNGRIYIGTGMDGQLFEVDEDSKERSEVARLDHGQIHKLFRRRDGSIIVATGDPGKLYVLKDQYAVKGTVISEVLDAKIISKWGSLRWKADTPRVTAVSVAVRTGNVADPDDTWSDWSEEQTDPQQAAVTAPTARFLQYRVTLSTDNSTSSPALNSLVIRYMTTNQAPEVNSIEVPDLDAENQDNPKKIKIKWTATDPNEDDLTFDLYVRKDGWKNWVRLEERYTKKDYEWDTTTAPSGTYRFKVVASDRKDNPAADALTGERVSAPFAVAHTPPTVTIKVAGMDGDRVVVQATAVDPLVRLTSASFAVNGKKWTHVFPTDGLFDSKTENFRFKTEALKPGTYVLVLRVRDAAGNTGSADVVFTVQARGQR